MQTPPPRPEITTPQGEHESNLLRWLTDRRTAEYFGDTWKLRADVLAAVITGGNLAEVARQHKVSRAAASKTGRRAKTIFGNLQLTSKPL